MFGFTANSTIGTSAISYVNKESVFYCCHGHFFQTGVGMELDACGDNDEIDLEADLSQKKLRWRKNGTLLREIDVPKTMKDRTLYMAMLMNYEGEESLLMALWFRKNIFPYSYYFIKIIISLKLDQRLHLFVEKSLPLSFQYLLRNILRKEKNAKTHQGYPKTSTYAKTKW